MITKNTSKWVAQALYGLGYFFIFWGMELVSKSIAFLYIPEGFPGIA
jgi:hypothetical protein